MRCKLCGETNDFDDDGEIKFNTKEAHLSDRHTGEFWAMYRKYCEAIEGCFDDNENHK